MARLFGEIDTRQCKETMSAQDQATFRFLADNTTDVICRAGLDLVLSYASPSSLHILGWQPEEMIGKRFDAFVPMRESEASLANATDAPAATHDDFTGPVRIHKKDGSIAWVEIKQRMVSDLAGGTHETVFVVRDVTERKALEERISLLTPTDLVTGLCTHQAFDEFLEREWARAVRENSCISVLLLDFDQFKYLHPGQAHTENDCCLQKAAVAVLGALRATDIAAHYATEGIAIILPATGPTGAAKVAEKVRSAVHNSRAARVAKGGPCSDVRIGIATVFARPAPNLDMPELLVLAANLALRRTMSTQEKSAC
jgi:diguanylate cyclase (GGDEF)-like protein/PAS domain S-box-containing protein